MAMMDACKGRVCVLISVSAQRKKEHSNNSPQAGRDHFG